MINAKSFMEFFEKEYGATFNEKARSNPYNDPAYESDYDRFLEEEGYMD